MVSSINSLFLFLVLCTTAKKSKALYSDNASNDDFSCPAFTTCPVACARSIDDCPKESSCPEGSNLCIDGSCASVADGGCDNLNLINPCIYDCAPIACTKQDTFYEDCTSIFGEVLDYSDWCTLFTWSNLERRDQSSAVFMFFYLWISITSLFVYMWCAFNQRFKPMHGSTQDLQEAVTKDEISHSNDSQDSVPWTQTSYRSSMVGNFIYILTIITLVMFHVLLGLFTVFYYWTEQGILLQYDPLFEDETQILFFFIIIW